MLGTRPSHPSPTRPGPLPSLHLAVLLGLASACGAGGPDRDAGPILVLDDGGAPLSALPTALAPAAADSPPPDALRALDPHLGAWRALCSGEGDHGVGQSWTLHGWIAERYIRAGRVRTIALEHSRANTRHLDAFVQGGEQDDLVRYFETTAGLAIVDGIARFARRLRRLREEGCDVRITGFDLTIQVREGVRVMLAFLDRAAPSERVLWEERFATMDLRAFVEHSEDLVAYLDAAEQSLREAVGEGELVRARRDAVDLRAGARFLLLFATDDFEVANATYREPAQAAHAARLIDELPGDESLLLIGHNVHCSADRQVGLDRDGAAVPSMGTRLRERYGAAYQTVGQLYGGGRTRLANGRVIDYPAVESTLEWAVGESLEADVALVPTRWRGAPFDQPTDAVYLQDVANGRSEHVAYLFLREAEHAGLIL
ncbi:MAG: erythromycin esterase family protein [Sandaracinaceae bacterium]